MKIKKIPQIFFFMASIHLFLGVESCDFQNDMNDFEQTGQVEGVDDDGTLQEAHEDEDLRGLTNDFRGFPSSRELVSFIDHQVSPPSDPCAQSMQDSRPQSFADEVDAEQREPLSLAAQGGRRTLATIFQSCEAIDEVITPRTRPLNLRGVQRAKSFGPHQGVSNGFLRNIFNTDAYVNSHPVLSKLSEDENYPEDGCRDMTETPPVYGFGSRFGPNRSGEVNLHRRGVGVSPTSRPAVSIDCSSFISIALANSGLKIDPNSSSVYQDNTTLGFHHAARDPNNCLDRPSFNSSSTLESGDMINLSSSHIIMVDEVGEDPLGVEKHAQTGRCNDISQNDFDFTYLQSGSFRNGHGPSRVQGNVRTSPSLFNNLRLAAVRACFARVEGREEISQDDMSLNSKFDIIRHRSDDPSCVSEENRNPLQGEDCITGCENLGDLK